MTEILLFHHAQGQTPGFLAFADELRAEGQVVHTPDLYDGMWIWAGRVSGHALPNSDGGKALLKKSAPRAPGRV